MVIENNQNYFDFLMELRDSGVTNMWGAAPFLVEAFGVTHQEARKILVAWIESFK